jgi:hypothetical protein
VSDGTPDPCDIPGNRFTPNVTPAHLPVWWSISEEMLLEMLRRAHKGEDPELIYAEQYANADVTHVEGD